MEEQRQIENRDGAGGAGLGWGGCYLKAAELRRERERGIIHVRQLVNRFQNTPLELDNRVNGVWNGE